MLLLAADTSGKQGSIALAQCEGDQCAILEVVPLAGGTFSAQLVPQIAGLLEKNGFSKHDLGGFAAVSGPGSFTGLRVGLAAIKALAEVLEKPIAAVSLLEAIALSAHCDGEMLAALEAGRNEVYVGDYIITNSVAQVRRERLSTREELFQAAANALLITPDSTIEKEAVTRCFRVQQVRYPQSDVIAQIGWQKIQSGHTVSPLDLEANYIRRSDAEIFSTLNR